jgi:hypothetical protein
MKPKMGQIIGLELPLGQREVSAKEFYEFMSNPEKREALELCQRADQFADGTPIGRHAAFEVMRNTKTGKNFELDNIMAEKIRKEKQRMATSA